MEFKDLPTTEDFTEYDWREVLGTSRWEGDPGEVTATGRHAGNLTGNERVPVKLDEFTKVLALYATTAGGQPCHELDAVILIEDVDRDWWLCEAWTDCTGWGCQDGVEWWVGTQELIRKLITAEQARKLNEVGWR